MSSVKFSVTFFDVLYSRSAVITGLAMPKPPYLTGSASLSRCTVVGLTPHCPLWLVWTYEQWFLHFYLPTFIYPFFIYPRFLLTHFYYLPTFLSTYLFINPYWKWCLLCLFYHLQLTKYFNLEFCIQKCLEVIRDDHVGFSVKSQRTSDAFLWAGRDEKQILNWNI